VSLARRVAVVSSRQTDAQPPLQTQRAQGRKRDGSDPQISWAGTCGREGGLVRERGICSRACRACGVCGCLGAPLFAASTYLLLLAAHISSSVVSRQHAHTLAARPLFRHVMDGLTESFVHVDRTSIVLCVACCVMLCVGQFLTLSVVVAVGVVGWIRESIDTVNEMT